MLSILLDFVGEYIRAKESSLGWLGRDRLQEMEYDFNRELDRMIDARIRAACFSFGSYGAKGGFDPNQSEPKNILPPQ
jgi:hypothetical protein